MKKWYSGLAALALLTLIFYGVLAGKPFLQMAAGPLEEFGERGFEQLEGEYITYEVTHPVVSYIEEYYSGDSQRVSKMAYVTYDEERQVFLKIVVPDHKTGGMDGLMKAVNRSEELKASWGDRQAEEERPVPVSGTLTEITDADEIREILEAMTGSESMSTSQMNEQAQAQTGWYMIELGYIGGISGANLSICAVAAGAALLVLLICLFSLGKKQGGRAGGGHSGSAREQLLEKQRAWLEPWCVRGNKRRGRQSALCLIGAPAVMLALGLAVGADLKTILACHLAIGLAVGELMGVAMLAGGRSAFSPDKLIRMFEKSLDKYIPSREEQEALAEDVLAAETDWKVLEKGKEDILYGVLGKRYWVIFTGKGSLAVMDAERMERLETETVSGQVRVNNVRTNYLYYNIRAFYQGSRAKKSGDVSVNFNEEDTAGRFMMLARKRLGERADEVIQP